MTDRSKKEKYSHCSICAIVKDFMFTVEREIPRNQKYHQQEQNEHVY